MNKFDILPEKTRTITKIVFVSFAKELIGVQSFFDDVVNPSLGEDSDFVRFWLDSELELYNKFGMGRSFKNTWSLDTVKAYAGYIRDGKVLPSYVHGEDVYQLGGDVVVENGVVKKVFVSKSPVDRVQVSMLL